MNRKLLLDKNLNEDERRRLFMGRREFLLASGGAVLSAGSLTLFGCGGGGGGGNRAGTLTLSAAKGTIVLPAGAAVKITEVANLFAKSPPYPNNSFDFVSATEAPLLTTGNGPNAGAVLYGLLQNGNAQLSAHSTAIVLAYYVLGVGFYPAEAQNLYLAEIGRAVSLPRLENAVSAAIVARGEGWLSGTDSTLVAALAAMQNELSAHSLVTRGVILDKTGRVSGLQINADGAGSMTITNFYRRRSYVYVDRVSYKDKATGSSIDFKGLILPQPIKIPPVRGVGNGLATLGLLFGGQKDFWEPVVSAPIGIPVNPVDAASTTYTATAAGLGVGRGDFDSMTQVQKDGWWEVAIQALLIDYVAPMLAGILIPLTNKEINDFADFAGTGGALKDIINAISASPDIRAKVQSGNIADAMWDVVVLIAKTDTLRNVFLQVVGDFLAGLLSPNAPFGLNGTLLTYTDKQKAAAEKLAGNAKGLLTFISSVNLATQIFDSLTQSVQIANCNLADIFTLEVTNAIAKLNPDKAIADRIQAAINFTASVTNADLQPDTLLNYQWTCKCKFGDISDGVKTNTSDGTSFASNSKVLAYAPNGKAIGGDVETIMVQIFKGPFNKRVAIGTATSVVTFNATLTPDKPSIAINGKRDFTVNLTDEAALGASYEWTLTGGHGSIGNSATVVTATPSITYTAGNAIGEDTLSVRVVGPDKTVRTTASTLITVTLGVIIPSSTQVVRIGFTYSGDIQGTLFFGFWTWKRQAGATKYTLHVHDNRFGTDNFFSIPEADFVNGAPVLSSNQGYPPIATVPLVNTGVDWSYYPSSQDGINAAGITYNFGFGVVGIVGPRGSVSVEAIQAELANWTSTVTVT